MSDIERIRDEINAAAAQGAPGGTFTQEEEVDLALIHIFGAKGAEPVAKNKAVRAEVRRQLDAFDEQVAQIEQQKAALQEQAEGLRGNFYNTLRSDINDIVTGNDLGERIEDARHGIGATAGKARFNSQGDGRLVVNGAAN